MIYSLMTRTSTIALVTVIVIILAGLGAFMLLNSSKNPAANQPVSQSSQPATQSANSSSSTNQQVVEVSYTDSGFTPANVTIKQGESVKWTNNSSKEMWVASNPHPVHTDYPGFDELASVGKGGSYTFNFTVLGVHKYHNHLSPRDGGTITVE